MCRAAGHCTTEHTCSWKAAFATQRKGQVWHMDRMGSANFQRELLQQSWPQLCCTRAPVCPGDKMHISPQSAKALANFMLSCITSTVNNRGEIVVRSVRNEISTGKKRAWLKLGFCSVHCSHSSQARPITGKNAKWQKPQIHEDTIENTDKKLQCFKT